MIVVAEGLKDASGAEIVDESAGVDAFGHKRLAGAGRYIEQQLSKRAKADPEIPDLMKDAKMYVKGINESPEIRAVTPGHLVRCGHSSAYDVNFGKEAGAGAFLLLKQGITGVTVAGISNGRIRYMETKEAIKQRHVDLDQVAVYEQMGTCFGRKPGTFAGAADKIQAPVERHL